MYYLIISIIAAAIGAFVLFLEHCGDPAALERDYAGYKEAGKSKTGNCLNLTSPER